ncbi:MAG: sigma-54 dependent transcriptional regulator [Spirochaetales bacterium]|jgi:DNA-binding NtrC family response regulator|nr:sigma-54 dependent transcriptional regulator [Spirochaetales bacterium]
MWNILLVDADPKVHARAKLMLPPDFSFSSCYTGIEALETLNQKKPDLIFCEISLPDMNGLDILRSGAFQAMQPAFIAISRSGNTHLIVDAVKAGADDYLVKPCKARDVLATIRKYLNLNGALYPWKTPRAAVHAARLLAGESPAMKNLRRQIRAYADTGSTILITGESGTGKDLVARELHTLSPRSSGPFYAVNCGALPETLFESEMFGSEKGAYTDAVARSGFFEDANGGTLFLDEVGELSAPLQVKLLRALEDRQVVHLGSHRPIAVDIRIIAATNRDIYADVASNRFRGDLFYRLNVLRIRTPSLRDRKEDIPLFCYTFLREFHTRQMAFSRGNRKPGTPPKFFCADALKKLTTHSWPGNIRELKNVVQRAFFLCEDSRIGPEYIELEESVNRKSS